MRVFNHRTLAGRLLPILGSLLLAHPGALPAQSTYALREDLLLDSLSTRKVNTGQHDGPHRAGRTGFWTTQGRLARGITNSTTWTYLRAAITDADGSADAGGANGGFSGWPGMDTWMRWNQVFPQSVQDQYFTEFTTMPTYGSGSTPNQKMMWAVACRLACETWGSNEVLQVSNAGYGYADKTGRDYILAKSDFAVKHNFEERWAKHYLEYTLGPLRSIADLSTDPVLRQRARMTWNWGWMDIAPSSFNGRWSLPAGRGSMTADGNSFDISEFGSWLMFGGPSPASLLDADQSMLYTQQQVPPVAQPPPPIEPEMLLAATKRDVPYTRRSLARLFETQFATAYVRSNYTLYSQFEGDTTLNADGTIRITDLNNNGVPSNDWNSERWGLMWDDAPAYGPAGLNMKPPTSYGWCPGCGIGPGEDVVQHAGTIVGILNIPASSSNTYTKDYIPTNVLAVVDDTATLGRLFLHYRGVLVSIFRTDIGTFTWPPASTTPCTKRGFAIETAAPGDYPQTNAAGRLAAFRADVLANGWVDTNNVWAATNSIAYADRLGHVLEITFGEGGKIDGEPVDYVSWPASESPWSSQQQMGNMFVFGTNRTLLWNYKNWTERTNNRPRVVSTAAVNGNGASSVDVNLASRVVDTETPASNLQYRILSASNGVATLLADGVTARFTPSANVNGGGSFDFAASDAFVDHRLIFHYDFEQADPVAGGLTRDASSQDRHATAQTFALGSFAAGSDVPPALAGRSSGTLHLSSSGLGYARLFRTVHPATLNLRNDDWTFAAWFKRASYQDNDILFYAGAGDGFSGGGDELYVFCPAQTNTVRVSHYDSVNAQDVSIGSPAGVNTGKWHHIALSFEKTGFNTGHVHLHLDGARIATRSNLTWAVNQDQALVIGGIAADSSIDRSFHGALDDVALYRGRLTTNEIARLAGGSVAQLAGLMVTGRVAILSPPAAPFGLTATPLAGSIALTWQAVAGVGGYVVKRGTVSTGPFTNLVAGLATTNWNDAAVTAGVTYFYTVTATNASGASQDSLPASATIPTNDISIWTDTGLTAWRYAATVSFAGYTRAETLTNIPLLVVLGTKISGFSYTQFASASGHDLRFAIPGTTNVLNHEIGKWDTNGSSFVWVQVPRLTNGTVVSMHWSNPAATLPMPGTTNGATWSNGFVGVWHLDSTNATDSSPVPQNAVTNSGTPVTGIVAGAMGYNGTSQFTVVAHDGDFNLKTNFEIQCWFRVDASNKPAVNNYLTLTSKEVDSNNRNWWLAMRSDGTLWWKSSPGVDVITPDDLADGRWHHAAAVHDGTVARYYVDGVQVASDATPGVVNTQVSAVCFGAENMSTRFFKGPIDELRVSAMHRSSNWVWATYYNIASNASYNAIGSVRVLASNLVPQLLTLPATGVTATNATLNGTLRYPGPTSAVVTVFWGPVDGGTNAAAWARTNTLGARAAGAFSVVVTSLPPGIVYFRASASNASGIGWSLDTLSFATLPAAPQPVLVPAGGPVCLAWPSVSGAGSYALKRSLAAGGPHATVLAGIVGTNANDATAVVGVTNFYVVSARNAIGEGPNSTEVSVFPVSAPAVISAVGSNSAIRLAWSAVSGATGYVVQRSLNSDGPYEDRTNTAGTTWLDTAVTNGVAYFYVVTATTPGFESGPSVEAAASPVTIPHAPGGLTATAGNGSAHLAWHAVSNALTYRVKRATTNGGPYATVASGLLAPSHVNSGLANGTSYYFVVSAVNGAGESTNSAQVSVVPVVQPNAFTNGSAGNWNAVTWLPNPPGKPVQDFDTLLVFTNTAAVASTNDLGQFVLNRLELRGRPVGLAGSQLFFAGTAPSLTASQNVAHAIALPMTLTSTTSVSIATGTTTVSGVLGGQGGLTKAGNGLLLLTATNAYAGVTRISDGAVRIQNPGALAPDAGGTVIASGGALELVGNIAVVGETLTLTGSGAGDGALLNVAGTNEWAGDITAVQAGGVSRIGSDAGRLIVSGDIRLDSSPTAQLVLQGVGAIRIDGVIRGDSLVTSSSDSAGLRTLAGENTYSGSTRLNGGTLSVASLNRVANGADSSSLGAPTTVADGTLSFGYATVSATLHYTGPGESTDRVLDLAGSSGGAVIDHAGSGLLRFESDVTVSGAGDKTLTLRGGTNGVGEISGAIPDNSTNNLTALTKDGAGTWILSGTNTYTGTTLVKTGALILNGAVGGSVIVSNGALSGSGFVAKNLTVSGGTNAPGDGVGVMTVGGNFTLSTNATLRVEIAGPDSSDQIALAGTSSVVTLSGRLAVAVTNAVPTNTPFIILSNAGSAAVAGVFSGRPEGSIFTASSYSWRISYTNGDGNDVALTALQPSDAAPAPPTNLVATAPGASLVQLTWSNKATNAIGLVVERSADGTNFAPIADIPMTNRYSDTGVRHDRTYWYRLRAYASFASFSPSTPAVAVTTPSAPVVGWWSLITFTNYPHAETLTNFPLLVVLGTNVPGFSYDGFLAPLGGDLRFLSGDRKVDLNYEIERWDESGDSSVWVQIPRFTNGVAIWCGWGDPSETNAPDCTTNGATWSEGYLGVWHLGETAEAHLDSAMNLPTTRVADVVAMGVATGVVGFCDDFDGSEHVRLPDMGLPPKVTVECWANLNRSPPDALRGLVSSDPWSNGVCHFRCNSNLQVQASLLGGGTLTSASNAIVPGEWFHASYAVAGSGGGNFRLYVNGQQVGSGNGTASNDLMDVNLAREYGGRHLDARLDEIRISAVARSSNWLWATCRSIASNASFAAMAPAVYTPPAAGFDLYALQIANAVLRSPLADADNDGFANLLEYATGGNPTNADSISRVTGAASNGIAYLIFSRNTDATDATLIVERSNSLTNHATWSGIATNLGGSWGGATNAAETGAGVTVSVSVYDNTVAATNRFMRLRVVRP